MKVRVRVIWTQWYLGVWWWPVRKDLAFGLLLGPLSFTWTRKDAY
jgi:hypothetical protein